MGLTSKTRFISSCFSYIYVCLAVCLYIHLCVTQYRCDKSLMSELCDRKKPPGIYFFPFLSKMFLANLKVWVLARRALQSIYRSLWSCRLPFHICTCECTCLVPRSWVNRCVSVKLSEELERGLSWGPHMILSLQYSLAATPNSCGYGWMWFYSNDETSICWFWVCSLI